MTTAAIVELACLILAFACVCFVAESRTAFASERIDKILAQELAKTYLARALDAEAVIRNAASPEFEKHVDEALEQAEPTPDLRRIR